MADLKTLADFDALPLDEQTAILRSGDDRLYQKWGLAEYDPPLSDN